MNEMIDPRILQPSIEFEVESYITVSKRYGKFGCDLINTINSLFGESVIFLKDPDTDDVWGFSKGKFGFQLDPDLEIINIWEDELNFTEFGSWLNSPIKEAIKLLDRFKCELVNTHIIG